jgi:AraC family transcriptional regulator
MLKKRTVATDSEDRASSLLGTRASLAGQSTDERAQILHDWQARRVCEYIDARFGTPIRISDLSAITKRNVRHFARAFKRTFGETPLAYLVRRRVERASQMMLRSDAPLSEIALTCGFSDQAHLSKRFRQYIGQTPGAWRRERTLAPKHSGLGAANSPVPEPTITERSLLRE